jgi:hypothetical protein
MSMCKNWNLYHRGKPSVTEWKIKGLWEPKIWYRETKIRRPTVMIRNILLSQNKANCKPKMFLLFHFTFTFFGKEFRAVNWIYVHSYLENNLVTLISVIKQVTHFDILSNFSKNVCKTSNTGESNGSLQSKRISFFHSYIWTVHLNSYLQP